MSPPRERVVVAALVLVAGLRVFAFSAAFPFFNGVDEHQHFDAVVKYSRGLLPGPGRSYLTRETGEAILQLSSPEFLRGPADFPQGRIPSPEAKRAARPTGSPIYERLLKDLTSRQSLQFSGPPLYYAVAGLWYRTGKALGLEGLAALYWVRWLNALCAGAVVALAWGMLASRYPRDAFLRLGVPGLVAFYPNDFFFAITNDVFAPVIGAGAFWLLVRIAEPGRNGLPSYAAAGALCAALFLNKYNGLSFVALAVVVALARLASAGGERLPELRGWLVFALAALPGLGWLARNASVVGSLTGQQFKMELAGFHLKAWSELPDHPIFRLSGLWDFLGKLFTTFWRGEFWWLTAPMGIPPLDTGYAISTALLLTVAAGVWLWQGRRAATGRIEGLALASVTLAVGLLALLSVITDFGTQSRPSNDFPYLVAGRYLGGVLVPVALLYLLGLRACCGLLPERIARVAPGLLLALWIGVTLCSEILLSLSVFRSEYNWFHAIR